MRPVKRWVILGLGLALLLMGIQPATAAMKQAEPRTLIIALKNGQFSSIQEAVKAANPGDTLVIKPGVYHERIVLDRSLKLLGEGDPVLDGGGRGDVITVLADRVTIQGLVVTNSGRDLSKDEAGIKVKSSHNVITRNNITKNTWGIYLHEANDNVVSHNLVRGNTELVQPARGNGIHLWKSDRNICDNNELADNRDALYLSFANHNTISNNMAYGQRYGIHYMYSNHNTLLQNVLHDNLGGIAMMNSSFNTIRKNQTFRNTNDGILVKDLDDNIIEENISFNNRQAFYMYNCNRNKLSNNLFAASLVGLNLSAGSDENVFVQNSWVENNSQVKVEDTLRNRWDNGATGNYWSNYTGYDLDDNGTGDVAYWQSQLIENLTKEIPVIKLLFNSPAMQAIQLAEKAFPVLRSAGVIDHFPVMRPTIDFKKLSIDWNMQFQDNGPIDTGHDMAEFHHDDGTGEMDMVEDMHAHDM